MKKEKNAGESRFEMVKERHKKTAEKAMAEKKADEMLYPLLKFIASTKNFFTSSSCAGRILLLGIPRDGGKKEAYFHKKWHRTVKLEEVWKALQEKTNGILWFKMDAFILHLGTDRLENANKAIKIMNSAGVKRGGIIAAKKGKFIIEFQGTENINVPVKDEEKILVEKDYLDYLIEKANKKIEKNYERLKKIEIEARKKMK